MKLNFKTICKALNAHAESDSYDKPATLRVELTGFQAIHKARAGRNGVGELVELVTRVIEAKGVHIATHDRSNLISVYIRACTRSGHGFGSDKGVFLRLKDAKGKYHSVECRTAWETDEIEVNNLSRVIGETVPAEFQAEEFAEYVKEQRSTVIKLVKQNETPEDAGELNQWAMEQMQRTFSKKFYQELVKHDLEDERLETFNKLLSFAGVSLVTLFVFTERLWCISPDYVEETKQGLEIGWTERHTYNSLPATLRIVKTREIKMVKLADIGVETSGYYNHGDNMRILPEQVAEAKRFAARFRSKQAKVTEKIIQAARKAG